MPRVLVDEAAELIDHVPYVPKREELSPSWVGFFDGYDRSEAEAGQKAADVLTSRFGTPNAPEQRSTHEVLVTHAYQIAWLVCHALDTPPQHWISLVSIANTGLTVIERTQGEPAGVIMVNDLSHLPAELRWTGGCRREAAMNVVDLIDATGSDAGGKAAPLAQLLQAGFNVPQGFVVPASVYRIVAAAHDLTVRPSGDAADIRAQILDFRLPNHLVDDISNALEQLTEAASAAYVAVRSSSNAEDSIHTSVAGQHDSFLAMRGTEQVCQALLKCWASLWSDRAVAYRTHQLNNQYPPDMAVVVQRFVDADVSGIMFTGDTTVLEASWGLGEHIVAGQLTPDSWRVEGTKILDRRRGDQTQRTDRHGSGLGTRPVAPRHRTKACLTDDDVLRLATMGRKVSTTLGGHRDIEWAMDGETIWILQARPVTSTLPNFSTSRPQAADTDALTGEPASPGTASGPVRLMRGPADFATVEAGDVIVCRTTDPAWTPLFSLAAAVVTEVGGVLSHAAIVAREVGIPAVLAVPRATELLKSGSMVTIDGNLGVITTNAL